MSDTNEVKIWMAASGHDAYHHWDTRPHSQRGMFKARCQGCRAMRCFIFSGRERDMTAETGRKIKNNVGTVYSKEVSLL